MTFGKEIVGEVVDLQHRLRGFRAWLVLCGDMVGSEPIWEALRQFDDAFPEVNISPELVQTQELTRRNQSENSK
jgi:hypothetical protein